MTYIKSICNKQLFHKFCVAVIAATCTYSEALFLCLKSRLIEKEKMIHNCKETTFKPLTMRPLCCLNMSVVNCPMTWHHIPGEWNPLTSNCFFHRLVTKNVQFYKEVSFNLYFQTPLLIFFEMKRSNFHNYTMKLPYSITKELKYKDILTAYCSLDTSTALNHSVLYPIKTQSQPKPVIWTYHRSWRVTPPNFFYTGNIYFAEIKTGTEIFLNFLL